VQGHGSLRASPTRCTSSLAPCNQTIQMRRSCLVVSTATLRSSTVPRMTLAPTCGSHFRRIFITGDAKADAASAPRCMVGCKLGRFISTADRDVRGMAHDVRRLLRWLAGNNHL
jgi:hypothetical protein